MQTNPSQLRDFAERYTAAWCSQDAASVAAHYEATGALKINDGLPSVGRSAITEAAQSFMTAFPDMLVVMDHIRARDDDRIEYHWTLTGTNTGPGGTGHRVRISGFEIWQIGPGWPYCLIAGALRQRRIPTSIGSRRALATR